MESILLLYAFVIFIFFFNFGLIHFSGIRVCVVSIVNLNAIWCWRCTHKRGILAPHKKKKRMQWPITQFRLYIQICARSYWACFALACDAGKATLWKRDQRAEVVRFRRWDKVINQSEYDFSSGFFFSLFSLSPKLCLKCNFRIYAVKLWDHCPFILLYMEPFHRT